MLQRKDLYNTPVDAPLSYIISSYISSTYTSNQKSGEENAKEDLVGRGGGSVDLGCSYKNHTTSKGLWLKEMIVMQVERQASQNH